MLLSSKKINKRKIGTVCIGILIFITSFLLFGSCWVFRTWFDLSIEEIIYHIGAPLTGTSSEMIVNYLMTGLLPAIIVELLFILWCVKRKDTCHYKQKMIFLGTMACLVLIGNVVYAAHRLNAVAFITAQMQTSTFVDDNYVDPATTDLKFPEKKRNLIYIFLESMETAYQDTANGGVFNKNRIPELTELAHEGENFSGGTSEQSGAHALPWTTWTAAAMFAETSGLPLHVSIDVNSMDTQEHFFPGITNIGDVLDANGYKQVLLIGSDAKFAGRNILFTEHGNYDIRDYNYAIEKGLIPEDYYVWWGYEDEYLFKFAKNTLKELSKSDEPFNLTMLTVDTHFEDGYVCDLCDDTFGEDQYSNVLACSSRQVAKFIQWVKKQDFYENTTIVLCGDHPTMDGDYLQDIPEDYDRTVYTAVLNAACDTQLKEKRTFSTFDLFPTTLAAMGVEIEGERLGLGTNLFSNKETILEQYGYDYVDKELYKNSKLISEMSAIDDTDAWKQRQQEIEEEQAEYIR